MKRLLILLLVLFPAIAFATDGYYFVITAYDNCGFESGYSNKADSIPPDEPQGVTVREYYSVIIP